MKIFFFCMLSLFAFSSLAQETMGGQTGNGGNGCWYKDDSDKLSWKTIEELKYWHIMAPAQSRYSSQHPNEGTIRLRARPIGSYYEKDFFDTIPTTRAIQRFKKIARKYPKVHLSLMSHTKLLKKVMVAQYDSEGVYEGDITNLFFKCIRFSPALVTLENGKVIAYLPIWNSITAMSSEIVIMHEIIRFAQMFHPPFEDLSNEELQKLTALFFSVQSEATEMDKILSRFEARLN